MGESNTFKSKRDIEANEHDDASLPTRKKKKLLFEEPQSGEVLVQLLENKDTSAAALKWLVHLTENDNEAIQVVEEFCRRQQSSDFAGILRFLTLSSGDSAKQKRLVCLAVERVLLLLSSGEKNATIVKFAKTVCQHDHLRAISALLATPNCVRVVLKLLTALVVTNTSVAQRVISGFNWDQFKKYISEAAENFQVVRSCLAYFVISLFLQADEIDKNQHGQKELSVVAAAVTGKGRCIFDILFDKLPTILEEDASLAELILDTILKKVCGNSHINKTAKMKLFNEQNNEHLLRLLSVPVGEETTIRITESCLAIFRCLFTDTKLGIVFFDSKFATKPGSSANSNILATKLISFLITQQNVGLLSLLVDILTACPDQIPHYFDNLKGCVRRSDRLLANAIVVAKLPLPSSSSLPLLTALCLPQSPAFFDQVRILCKSKQWESVTAPVTFLTALLEKCVRVFSSLAKNQQRNALSQFFWQIKNSFVDPDKVLQLMSSATDWLKTGKGGEGDKPANRRDVLSSACSCLYYLISYTKLSSSLMLSLPLDKLLRDVAALATKPENSKLRKPLARLCLTVGPSIDWSEIALGENDSCSEDSLLHWIIDEAAIPTPSHYSLILAEVFIKLSGAQVSQGELATVICLLTQEIESPSSALIALFDGLRKSTKRPKQAAVSFVLKHFQKSLPDDVQLIQRLKSANGLILSLKGQHDSISPEDKSSSHFTLLKLMTLANSNEIARCVADVFSTFRQADAVDVFCYLLVNWLLNSVLDSDSGSNKNASLALSAILQLNDRNSQIFLRVLLAHPHKLASLDKITKLHIDESMKIVCRFIHNNPDDVVVCLGRQIASTSDNLCQITGKRVVRFVKNSFKTEVNSDFIKAVATAISLCQKPSELTELAKMIVKQDNDDDGKNGEGFANILMLILSELNFRNAPIDHRVFTEFFEKTIFTGDDEGDWTESADLLFETISSCNNRRNFGNQASRALRSLISSSTSLKGLKRLVNYWNSKHKNKQLYSGDVAVFVAECLLANFNRKSSVVSSKTLRLRFELVSALLPVLPKNSFAHSALFHFGIKCLANEEMTRKVSLPLFFDFINHGNVVGVCSRSNVLSLLDMTASASAVEQVDSAVAVKAVTACLKAVKTLPLDEHHHLFLSLLSSLLNWCGINSQTLSTVAKLCSVVDVSPMKSRHRSKLVNLLIDACTEFEGTEKWMVHGYIVPTIIQCLFVSDDIATNKIQSLIDATESLLFDECGHPHQILLDVLNAEKTNNDDKNTNLYLRCLHALLWYRGSTWRSYDSVWRSLVPALLSGYSATLSERDQLILCCLAPFDNAFDDDAAERSLWAPYQPCIWGYQKRLKSKQATGFSPTDFRQQSADVVLDCLSSNLLLTSALEMPVERNLFDLERGILFVGSATRTTTSSMYDPAFLVPVFVRTFASMRNWPITTSKFVSSNALSYLLAALSLKDDRLRALAYTAIVGFERCVRSQRRPSQPLLNFLNTVRLSIPEPNARIAPVMATFLVRLPGILFGHKTSSAVSKPISNYLKTTSPLPLAGSGRPTVPGSVATAFYYPSDVENARNQRAFLLDLASSSVKDLDSVATTRDGFNILPLLVSLLNSPLCTSPAEYSQILKLFADLAQSSEAAVHRLVRLHHLHLLLPTFSKDKQTMEGGKNYMARNKSAAQDCNISSLQKSFFKAGLRFSNISKVH